MLGLPATIASQVTALGGGLAAQLDSALMLEAIGLCPSVACLSRGSATVVESGSDPYTSWGRWTNGTAVFTQAGAPTSIALGANQGIHYLFGVPTVTMPTTGSFYYDLVGATNPTISDGSLAPGAFSGNARVFFSTGLQTRVALQATVTMPNAQYQISTPGGLGNPQASDLTMLTPGTFSGVIHTQPNAGNKNGVDCGAGGCSVQVQGGFYGQDAARMGLGYTIIEGASQGRTITGVGVFGKR